MAFNRLPAYADYNCICLIKYISEIPEITGFLGTVQAPILWIEEDNQFFPAQESGNIKIITILILQSKRGNYISDLNFIQKYFLLKFFQNPQYFFYMLCGLDLRIEDNRSLLFHSYNKMNKSQINEKANRGIIEQSKAVNLIVISATFKNAVSGF